MVSSIALAKEDFGRMFPATDGRPSRAIWLMYYTYIIESVSHPGNHYIGHTSDLKQRITEPNAE